MRGHYLGLAIGVVVLALVLTALGHPRRAQAPAAAPTPAPVEVLGLVIEDGHLSPAMGSVAKGTRVRLQVTVRGARGATLALAGYEDHLVVPRLAPGATWTGEFVADRPGEDFAWLLDGVPAGRLAVTGSHLIDGHR